MAVVLLAAAASLNLFQAGCTEESDYAIDKDLHRYVFFCSSHSGFEFLLLYCKNQAGDLTSNN